MNQIKSFIFLALSLALLVGPASAQYDLDPTSDEVDDPIFEADHEPGSENIQATWLELGRRVVKESVTHKMPFPFSRMISLYLQHSYGAARVGLIRLIEVLDDNMDYQLDMNEITDSFARAFVSPEDAIAMTFDLYDANADNFITRYEMARYHLVSESSEKDVYEIWKDVAGEFYEKDINGDDRLDVDEFIMYDLYDIGKTIAALIDAKGLI